MMVCPSVTLASESDPSSRAGLTPLLEQQLALPLSGCGPWEVMTLGPVADPDALRDHLHPWLTQLPYERDMPRLLLVPAGMLPERHFPWPVAFAWPATHSWQPLLQPWIDPGFGGLWIELVGDPDALAAQRDLIADRLYRALVIDPPPLGALPRSVLEELADMHQLSLSRLRALIQDARPLQRDREVVQLWTEAADGGTRAWLSVHAGSGPLHYALLPSYSPVWAEAVLEPRELCQADIAQLPRTVGTHQAAPYLRACAALGATRRQWLLEHLAEVIHQEAWELQVIAEPASHQAWCGIHVLGALSWHRWGLQRAAEGEPTFLAGGLGTPAVRLDWVPGEVAAAGPLFGLPVHLPRSLDTRDALRACTDWSLVAQFREQGISLRAGSKGLLRTWHPSSFAEEPRWGEWLTERGLVSAQTTLQPVAAILG